MRISNETKVGALTIIAVTIMILGFNFLRGKTFFKSGTFINAKYSDTKGLLVSNPVFVNGFQVGTVFEIENLKDNLNEINVSIKLNEQYKIPNNSIATIQENPLGTNSISVVLGNSNTYLKNGDTVKTAPATSLLGDFMNTLSPLGEQFKTTILSLQTVLKDVHNVLNTENQDHFKEILANLSTTSDNLSKTMASLESMTHKESGSIAQTVDNLNTFSKTLANNNARINNIVTNLDSATKTIKEANLGKTIVELQVALKNINTTLSKLNSGTGTAAKVMNDPELYHELEGTIKSLNTLVDDIKVHPKRYVNISVFGKKDKSAPLVKPLADTVIHE
jgi:phospholipid/cholesterol/gamma-HCH transport system substrate-binding protein